MTKTVLDKHYEQTLLSLKLSSNNKVFSTPMLIQHTFSGIGDYCLLSVRASSKHIDVANQNLSVYIMIYI